MLKALHKIVIILEKMFKRLLHYNKQSREKSYYMLH